MSGEVFPPWVEQPKVLILDTQLLILLIVGVERADLIGQDPTKGFSQGDFELLYNLAGSIPLIATQAILAEVNSWLNRTGAAREQLRSRLAEFIAEVKEHYTPSLKLAEDELFVNSGLTDISILDAATALDALIVTTDRRLMGRIAKRKIAILHFQDLRSFHI
jgi:rRNA-processing protein FCF1